MYVILSNSVGSRLSPSGEPNEATAFPNDFAIDYIRIYQAPTTMLVKADATTPTPVPTPAPVAKPPTPPTPPTETKPIIAILPPPLP